MTDDYSRALAVFTRTPVSGKTKTRLAQTLGDAAALAAHIELVHGCLDRLQLHTDTRCELWITEPAPIVTQWADQYNFALHYQCEGDLGTRMYHALQELMVSNVFAAVLVGTDCPSIDADYVQQAFIALKSRDLVFGPAEDGGYGLVGLRRSALPVAAAVFQEISWGGPRVLAQSLERAAAMGLSVAQLPVIWDVDEIADWHRYQRLNDD